jgi:hypothetical protein
MSSKQVYNIEDDDNWIDSNPITREETNSIAKAVANEFKGSGMPIKKLIFNIAESNMLLLLSIGHCYTCPNGHPVS